MNSKTAARRSFIKNMESFIESPGNLSKGGRLSKAVVNWGRNEVKAGGKKISPEECGFFCANKCALLTENNDNYPP